MSIYMDIGVAACLYIAYWVLLSQLIDGILGGPRLRRGLWLPVGLLNTVAVGGTLLVSGSPVAAGIVMALLMLAEFSLFYRDTFSGTVLCTLACYMHVTAIFMAVISVLCLLTDMTPPLALADTKSLLWIATLSFCLLDVAVIAVLALVPLSKVKLINRHKEQQWFIIGWMVVNLVFLLYISRTLFLGDSSASTHSNRIAACVASMMGLYIVLFFSFKTSSILGYREKNVELEHAIHQEQQYRHSMIRDALASYEVNLTRNELVRNYAEEEACDDTVHSYTEMLEELSHGVVYVEDAPVFLKIYAREYLLRLFEAGERETSIEYRRRTHGSRYIWVRAIINLADDVELDDVRAFIYVKDIDDEVKSRMELQRKAEQDPLTGLYNKNMTGKLIDEHLSVNNGSLGSAIFMIDVDNFKNINDHFGHVFGDAVLCELADKLVKIFRKHDIVGRVGGDEFIVFMRDCAVNNKVTECAAKICKAFEVTYKGADGQKYAISSSVGISLFPRDGSRFIELYTHADSALYESKRLGKNRYTIYNGTDFAGYTSQRTEIDTEGNVSKKAFRENRIEYVFKMLYESDSPVVAIHSVLELVARHFAFERGYIFETSKDGRSTCNTFEWCADGVTPEITNLQHVPIEAVATANSNFRSSGTFILKSLDDLQPIERAVLEPQGIKSMFQFGIFDKSRLLGFIGFDNCRSESVPSDTVIDEMKTICNVLATFFVKQYIDEVAAKDMIARQEVMNRLDNYIYVVNMDSFEVMFMNERVQRLMPDLAQGTACYDFFRGQCEQCADCPIRTLASTHVDRVVSELYNDKLSIWMETAASFLRWTDGSLACLIICTDITSKKEETQSHVKQLQTMAHIDPLTGSRSYHKFKEDARIILESQSELQHLLIKVDIENFKLINQMYGYDKGDEVLRGVARAMEALMRGPDEIFARIASDEFVALFTIEDKAEADMLYDRFIAEFRRCTDNALPFRFSFPHGRYIISPEDARRMDISDMFEKANIAHKIAKTNKATTVAYYDERMTKEALRVREVEDKMADALANDEFIIYLQPKYHLSDETIGGAEALARWSNDNPDLFAPGAFIPIFEQNGFITKLDMYIFSKVCGILRSWIDAGIAPVVVSVNFSRLHLGNPNFVRELCDIADSAGVDRSLLEVEITETVFYDHIDTLSVLLDEVHQSGFSMSMDDFGSGYSSLGMLKSLPVDVIKMDRCFFADQSNTERSRMVVGSIIQMADKLGIRIVAEGVEEQEHISFLRELNCDMVQGYYYAKPMPVDRFAELISKNAP